MIQKKFNIDMSPECESKLILEIRRTDVIEDALMHASKKKFCPTKTLKVCTQVTITYIFTYALLIIGR